MADARQQGRSWVQRLFGRNLRFGTNLLDRCHRSTGNYCLGRGDLPAP